MSNERALSGATWFFTAHGMTETAGLASLPKALQSYAGTVVVTAKGGTFTTTTAGIFNAEPQAFSQLDKIVRGTDKFSDSTGRLMFSAASVPRRRLRFPRSRRIVRDD